MRLASLGSGSGGNATLVDCTAGCVLVDAGLSAKQLVLRMQSLGIEPESLDGVLLTHEHGDHVKGLQVFSRQYGLPVYASALTREALGGKASAVTDWRLFSAGQDFEVSGISVTSFAISHDAVDPVGFVFESQQAKAAILTDLGHAGDSLKERLKGVRAMVLEANYCEKMLEIDEKRPWSLKQRIASRHGHLSNIQARDFAQSLQETGLEHLILGHLSRDCNSAEVALQEFATLSLASIQVASQDEPTAWISIVEEAEIAPDDKPTLPSVSDGNSEQLEMHWS